VRLSILNPLYDIVAWLIMHIHSILVPLGASSGWTWVLTIVVLVVLMRLLLLPLFVKQMHSQRKMLALAPEMKELRKRYKNDKQKLNEEMMKLYRENGANPLSGCLPLIAQLPVWYALLGVLEEITRWSPSQGQPSYGLTVPIVQDALHARIFGVSIADTFLHTPGTHVKVVIAIVVVCSAVTTFLTVRQSMKRGMMQTPTVDADNPMAGAQKYMAYIAPLFALSGLYWQFGLVIYWLASNLWTLGQQYFLFKKIPPLNAAAATAGATSSGVTRTSGTATRSSATRSSGARTSAARTSAARASGTPRTAGAAGAAGAKSRNGQTGGTSAAGKGAAAKSTTAAKGTTAAKQSSSKPATAAKQPAAAKPSSSGKQSTAGLGIPPPTPNGSGGMLRKLVRGRAAEPEADPEPPEVKLVRQQPQKQSRSKRTGKR
jgi:YidC/Oxa1 family membrane protein insertase